MNPTEILHWRRFSEGVVREHEPRTIPYVQHMATVAVSTDFTRYVSAMADKWPDKTQYLAFPPVEEVRWPFPDQAVAFVFEEPIIMPFLITSEQIGGTTWGRETDPHFEPTETLAMVVLPPAIAKIKIEKPLDPEYEKAPPPKEHLAAHVGAIYPVIYIHRDTSVTSSHLPFGMSVSKRHDTEVMGPVTRWERAFVEAAGHRLASLEEPQNLPRFQRRAIARTASPYRVLRLRTPDRPTGPSSAIPQDVEWSKRWMVRGHWRNQAYGHGMELRRLIWIDPYVKGPDDKPFDERDDIFHLGGK